MIALTIVSKPSKEAVREAMQQHLKTKTLPKTPEDYRRELGWLFLNPKSGECAR